MKHSLHEMCFFEHNSNYIQKHIWLFVGQNIDKLNKKYFQKLIDLNEISVWLEKI